MRNIVLTAVSAAAMLAFAVPAMAQDQWSNHDDQHEHLANHHDDVHDQLDQEHADAHDQGLSPGEHRQLHRELRYDHAQADYQIARQHQREHWRDQHRRRYRGYGYNGY
jgi:hypothetical protein